MLGSRYSNIHALYTKLAGGQLEVDDPLFNLLAVGILGTEELVLVVQPKLDLTGTVVDEAGEPIQGVDLAVRVRQELYREIGLTQFASFAENQDWETQTDRDGRFTIPEACGGSSVFLDARHAEYAPAKVELPAYASDDLVVVLSRVDGTMEVRGRVLDDGGTPIRDAQVSMGHTIERTDADGSFTLLWNRADGQGGAVFRRDDEDTDQTSHEQGPVHIGALKAGYAPARLELEETDLTSPVLLLLDREELSIAGRTVDPNGSPLPGIVVWARDLTHFGNYVLRQGEHSTHMAMTVEGQLRGGLGTRGVTSDEDGSFELKGLMPRAYQIQTCDPLSGALGEGSEIEAGEVGIELVLGPDPSLARVAGRIVSVEGVPIPGVEIRIQRSAGAGDAAAYLGPPRHLIEPEKTDADGAFEFPALATAGTTLFLYGDGIFMRWIPLERFGDLAHIEIVEPLLCELQVEFELEPGGSGTRLPGPGRRRNSARNGGDLRLPRKHGQRQRRDPRGPLERCARPRDSPHPGDLEGRGRGRPPAARSRNRRANRRAAVGRCRRRPNNGPDPGTARTACWSCGPQDPTASTEVGVSRSLRGRRGRHSGSVAWAALNRVLFLRCHPASTGVGR